jgi:hypothetical protein
MSAYSRVDTPRVYVSLVPGNIGYGIELHVIDGDK